ncbi:hypothetical protein KUH32_15015 [Thalassococcus sp. CAU 1522]|uniref:CENP-V/GFA domain-containing protein n=1 Tax=Thalassococcus arenae TaxID=2851652 RepID=A0ABS6NBY3_9RHOB|nr:DUF6151 family protein [Thalassococcus arenae]MBV2361074.1 hypothetical protein [Thalassococcus arenae]
MPRALSCSCGAMRWHVDDRAGGTHVACYCADCQTFANHLGKPDYLTNGGTEIFQTLPANIAIDAGMEHLALLRLSPNGLLRWYAGCCGTPLATTLPRASLPFVGVILPPGAPGFGPVTAHLNTAAAHSPQRQSGAMGAVFAILGRTLAAYLTGRRGSLFFDDGHPVRDPLVLTLDERNAARPR